MKEIEFNINDNVKIKLTQKGIDYYLSSYDFLPKLRLKTVKENFYKRIDKEGFVEMQFHQVMEYFGQFGFSMPEYFETVIKLEVK